MKVGVISDTHLADSGVRKIATKIIQKVSVDNETLKVMLEHHFKGVSVILHAGDLVNLSVTAMLESFGKVYAVAGNMDPSEVRAKLPEKLVVELGKFRIGLIHGWGSPNGLSQKVRAQFAGEKLDCVVFGHSHSPYDQVEDGVLMFNPGSPTDRRFAPRRTIGILHLEDKIWGEHIEMQ
jgi:uncharacterized protein